MSNKPYTTDIFVKKARQVHGDKYDYSKVRYTHSHTWVVITCQKHGDFEQEPGNHLRGKGCKRCANENWGHKLNARAASRFVDKAIKVHNNKYRYDQTKYVKAHLLVTITCPEHGAFWQKPVIHQRGVGCPSCHSSKGEEHIATYLTKYGIDFLKEWTEHNCTLTIRPAKFDFYLPNHNMLIEFDGQHHFEPVTFGGCSKLKAKKNFQRMQRNDQKKNRWAKKNGYKLLRIKYTEDIEEALKLRGPYCIYFHEEENDEIPTFISHT